MPLTYENTSRFIDAKGLTFHYHEAGGGEPLVCVGATAIGATAWGQLYRNFEGLSRHYRVLAVNLPPHGESSKDITAFNGQRTVFYADLLRDFMDALGIRSSNLYGGSPGAAVVMRFAMRHPDRAKKLVLDAPTQLGQGLFAPNPMEGPKANMRMGANPTVEMVRRTMETQFSDPRHIDDDIVRFRYESLTRPGYREALAKLTGPVEDMRPELDKIPHPSLVIFGAAERDVALDRGFEAIWRMPNARLHIFGHAGHWPQHERPEEWNRLVIGWLQEVA
ncbi:MAG: alpha/beta fold hydrolase [SAR202 cluster bacterium]|nr:alpha/beta fold hydrolase [SAR202 cluster bacterium]